MKCNVYMTASFFVLYMGEGWVICICMYGTDIPSASLQIGGKYVAWKL